MAVTVAHFETTASTAGAGVAFDVVGTTHYQQVKLVAGQTSGTVPLEGTTAAPSTSAGGLVVRQVDFIALTTGPATDAVGQVVRVVGTTTAVTTGYGANVWVMNPTVTIPNVVPTTTQAVATGLPVWLAPTQTISVSNISTVVSGTVSVSGVTAVTTQTVVAGLPVWIAGSTQFFTVNVSVSTALATTAQAAGTGALVWLGPNQSMSVISTVSTILGTVAVNVVAGGSQTTVVSGTLTVNTAPTVAGASIGVAVSITGTTALVGRALEGSTGPVTTAVFGLIVRVADTAVVSGTLTVNTAPTVAGASVTIQQGASVSAVVSGTVSVLNVVPVTTQASASVTGLPVWWHQTAAVAITPTVLTVNTAPTVAGASVTIQQGVSVTALVSGTVTILTGGGLQGSTTGSSGMSGILVWLGASQTVLVSTQVSGTVSLSGTAVVTLATGGTIATVLGTIPVTGTIQNVASVSTVLGTAVVTLATGGTVAALDVGRTNVLIMLTSTSVGISGTTMPFDLYVGLSTPVAGTTSWVVPAGKTFRVLGVDLIAQNSITTSPALVRLFVLASNALPTWTSTVPVAAAVAAFAPSAGVGYSAGAVQTADVAAGVTVGVAHSIGTSGASVVAAIVRGYLFP